MAHPYKNTGKCGTSPVKHVNTAGSIAHSHGDQPPHPPGYGTDVVNKETNTIVDYEGPKLTTGSPTGMFALPMGIYNRYQDHKKHLAAQGPQPVLDLAKIEAMKYAPAEETLPPPTEETPPGAPSGDPNMRT
jgi:hypothetical protein